MILALDPGPARTAWVLWDGERVVRHGLEANEGVLELVRAIGIEGHTPWLSDVAHYTLAVEMIASYGMAVGAEVFETCVWIGRYLERWGVAPSMLVYRREVKLELCGSSRAKDSNIRQALLDLVGPQGTKGAPGPTYGLKADEWAALGVAVTAERKLRAQAGGKVA